MPIKDPLEGTDSPSGSREGRVFQMDQLTHTGPNNSSRSLLEWSVLVTVNPYDAMANLANNNNNNNNN